MDAIQEIRELIFENHINVSELAHSIGWSRQRIHYILNSAKDIKNSDYNQIMHALSRMGAEHSKVEGIENKGSRLTIEAARLCDTILKSLKDGHISAFEKRVLNEDIELIEQVLGEIKQSIIKTHSKE